MNRLKNRVHELEEERNRLHRVTTTHSSQLEKVKKSLGETKVHCDTLEAEKNNLKKVSVLCFVFTNHNCIVQCALLIKIIYRQSSTPNWSNVYFHISKKTLVYLIYLCPEDCIFSFLYFLFDVHIRNTL